MTTGFRLSGLSILFAVALGAPVSADDAPASTPGATPAPAEQTTTPAATTEPAAGSSEEKVCRKDEATTGSRLGAKKICRTRKEWADLARDSQEALRNTQERSLQSNQVPDAGKN